MRTVLVAAAVTAVGVVGVALVALAPSNRPEFTVPDHFPTLDAAEIAPAPAGEPTVATFGSGCFWCTEAYFQQMKGVTRVVSGYSGGTVPDPTYEQVCGGRTGHAEVVQVEFDPKVISYPELLEVFWRSHDPTTPNRQGNDVGTQYRSAVFYHSERQKQLAEKYKAKIDDARVYRAPLVTEVTAFTAFYPATADHQNFYRSNPDQGYCRVMIGPKVEKLRKVFGDRVTAE